MRTVYRSGLVALFALAVAAGAQQMGSGNQWISGDGGIPMLDAAPVIDGDDSEWQGSAYHLWYGPSDITAWGEKYGFNRGPDFEPDRIVQSAAEDVDNNLHVGDDEDPADKGTDADWYGHFYFGWDERRFGSRGEHNAMRAEGQWSLYEAACATRSQRAAILRGLR